MPILPKLQLLIVWSELGLCYASSFNTHEYLTRTTQQPCVIDTPWSAQT